MEPMESRLTTMIYDPAGDLSVLEECIGDQGTPEPLGFSTSYTYDANGTVLPILPTAGPGSPIVDADSES